MKKSIQPVDFVPLSEEKRQAVGTELMCYHIGRKPQTARTWAMNESYPPALRPIRILGRLAWPVAGIKEVLGVSQ